MWRRGEDITLVGYKWVVGRARIHEGEIFGEKITLVGYAPSPLLSLPKKMEIVGVVKMKLSGDARES